MASFRVVTEEIPSTAMFCRALLAAGVKVAPSLRGYNTDGATIRGNPATGSLRGSSVHECRVLVAAGAEAKFTHVGGSPAPAPAVADYPATCVRNRNGEC